VYSWDFSDGTTASGASATHSYGAPGAFTVKLSGTDSRGAVAYATRVVTSLGRMSAAPRFSCRSFSRPRSRRELLHLRGDDRLAPRHAGRRAPGLHGLARGRLRIRPHHARPWRAGDPARSPRLAAGEGRADPGRHHHTRRTLQATFAGAASTRDSSWARGLSPPTLRGFWYVRSLLLVRSRRHRHGHCLRPPAERVAAVEPRHRQHEQHADHAHTVFLGPPGSRSPPSTAGSPDLAGPAQYAARGPRCLLGSRDRLASFRHGDVLCVRRPERRGHVGRLVRSSPRRGRIRP